MIDTTWRFALPLLAAGQAQKEMSHNEALVRLDMVVHAAVTAITDAPPADPAPGECWIVGQAPGGLWTGHGGAIAGWTPGGWRFLAAREGMRAWLGPSTGFALFSGGEWRVGEAHGKLIVEGVQVVGPRGPTIAEPAGGTTVDAEARAAIAAVLDAMRTHGLVDTD